MEGITTFTTHGRGIPRPKEHNADHLSLALEPEAAAIYCQRMLLQGSNPSYLTDSPAPSSSYLVLDIGGGTVDITAHELDTDGSINVIELPEGNDWGGTKVNEQFSLLLQRIVHDPAHDPNKGSGFSRLLASGDDTKVRVKLNDLIYKRFEDAKIDFGDSACGTGAPQEDEEGIIELPLEFIECYGKTAIIEGVASLTDDQIEFTNQSLCIQYTRMESLFKPAVDGVVSCVLPILETHKGAIKTVYLVGGFGGCKYVYEKLKTAFDAKFGMGTFQLIVPFEHRLAVAHGAVLYRLHSELIRSRKIDATYGIEVATQFDSLLHNKHYLQFDEEGIAMCNSVFLVFAQKGEVVEADNLFQTTVHPDQFEVGMAGIHIYCTDRVGIQYTEDEFGKATVRRVGELIIEVPNPGKLKRLQRPIKVLMDFSGPEIQAKAIYEVAGASRREESLTIDFLSSYI